MSKIEVNEIAARSGSTVSLASGVTPSGFVPTGGLLQTVNNSTTTATSTITASGQHSILTVSITPSSTSSKIFITAQASCQVVSASNAIIASDIYRGTTSGTIISRNYDGPTGTSNAVDHYWTAHHAVVDSPNTTSAQTYTFSIGRGSGGTTSIKTVGSAAHPIVMSAMEIAG